MPLPAAVAAAPWATPIETISDGGYVKVHCRPAGALPEGTKFKFRETVPAGVVDPEESVRAPGCPNKHPPVTRRKVKADPSRRSTRSVVFRPKARLHRL